MKASERAPCPPGITPRDITQASGLIADGHTGNVVSPIIGASVTPE